MESLSPGSCANFHANAPESYFNSIKFWKTPITTCDDGTDNCMAYDKWQSAWTAIKG
jgi:putative spermidine/putrescine transport system substrate-binding protein